jgi:hypothetical protein
VVGRYKSYISHYGLTVDDLNAISPYAASIPYIEGIAELSAMWNTPNADGEYVYREMLPEHVREGARRMFDDLTSGDLPEWWDVPDES